MELGEALKLEAGTRVVSNVNSLAPSSLTKDKTYVLVGNAIPLYDCGCEIIKGEMGRSLKGRLCNCEFPIIDDTETERGTSYRNFDLEKAQGGTTG